MRCKFCGSTGIHADTQHKTFSKGKAVAGAVMFGYVGAAAGLIGKDQKGYTCGACGKFMEAPMEFSTEMSIDSAVRDAKAGRSRASYEYFKSQYPHIEDIAPVADTSSSKSSVTATYYAPVALPAAEEAAIQGADVKNRYRFLNWQPDCPLFIEEVIIKATDHGDVLSLNAYNQSKQIVRSSYFTVTCYDDTGDVASTVTCVYQGLSLDPGGKLPEDKEFSLNTDIAFQIDLVCDKIALTDGSVWRNAPEVASFTVTAQSPMTEENFPRIKYVRKDLEKTCHLPQNAPLYFPHFTQEYWQCVCGHPSLPGESCRYCNATKDGLSDLLSQSRLQELQLTQVKNIASRRAEKSIALYDAAAKEIYDKAEARLSAPAPTTKAKLEACQEARDLFDSIALWHDGKERRDACDAQLPGLREKLDAEEKEAARIAQEERIAKEKREAEERKAAEERARQEAAEAKERKKKLQKKLMIFGPIAAAILIFLIVLVKVIIPSNNYKKATQALEQEDYQTAETLFTQLGEYKDASTQLALAKIGIEYDEAVALMDEENYTDAISVLKQVINDYSDYQKLLTGATESATKKAEAEIAKPAEMAETTTAAVAAEAPMSEREILEEAAGLTPQKDSAAQLVEPVKEEPIVEDSFRNVRSLLREAQHGKSYQDGLAYLESKKYDKAIEAFAAAVDFKDSQEQIKKAYYQKAENLVQKNETDEALAILKALGDYEGASELITETVYQQALGLLEKANNLTPRKNSDYGEYYDLHEQAHALLVTIPGYKSTDDLLSHFARRLICRFTGQNRYYRIYSKSGTLTSDENGNIYTVDQNDRLLQLKTSKGVVYQATYENGKMISYSKYQIEEDDNHRMISKTEGTTTITYKYDNAGLLISSDYLYTSSSGTYTQARQTSYSYNDEGELTSEHTDTKNTSYGNTKTNSWSYTYAHGWVYFPEQHSDTNWDHYPTFYY